MSNKWNKTAKWYPELLLFEDDKARKKAFAAAQKGIFFSGRTWAAILPIIVITPVLMWSLRRSTWLLPLVRESWFQNGIAGAISGGTAAFVIGHIHRKRIRRSLRESLIASGVPVCMQCGYQLRGLKNAQCPECGATFDPVLLCEQNDGRNASSE